MDVFEKLACARSALALPIFGLLFSFGMSSVHTEEPFGKVFVYRMWKNKEQEAQPAIEVK